MNAGIAQLVEHHVANVDVASSSLVSRSTLSYQPFISEKIMKPGDIVTFTARGAGGQRRRPNEGYFVQKGLLVLIRDNPSDVYDIGIRQGAGLPGYLNNGPRQIAEVLCNGKIEICWKRQLRPFVKNESR